VDHRESMPPSGCEPVTPEAYRRAVLDVVARIPRGRVMAYGAIATYLSEASGRASPRLVGQIMARHANGVPWHRVVRENGLPVRGHEAEALRRLLADGTPLRGVRVDMARAAWEPDEPAAAFLARR
jgi:methylated-DNA-protein-cysteine methyltransferase-like protein